MIEKIPLEIVVLFSEKGEIRPLKIFFAGKEFVIDKVYNKKLVTPKGSFGVAIEYNCLINGKKRQVFYDRYNSLWYANKEIIKKDDKNYNNFC